MLSEPLQRHRVQDIVLCITQRQETRRQMLHLIKSLHQIGCKSTCLCVCTNTLTAKSVLHAKTLFIVLPATKFGDGVQDESIGGQLEPEMGGAAAPAQPQQPRTVADRIAMGVHSPFSVVSYDCCRLLPILLSTLFSMAYRKPACWGTAGIGSKPNSLPFLVSDMFELQLVRRREWLLSKVQQQPAVTLNRLETT